MNRFSALLSLVCMCLMAPALYAQGPPFSGGQPTTPPAEAAPKGNSKIIGTLTDSTNSQPIEFAIVGLWDTKQNKPVDGTTTDEKGKFTLAKVAAGDYFIRVSFIGYKSKDIRNIAVGRRDDIDLGVIILSPDVVQLKEVNVVGQAALIEEKVDRLVYNAEKDVTSRGGDATDVMRKVPMLTVDLDGNVSLRGSSNVRVLINNKPSTIIATSVGDALRQIPADQIKSVEVITSPSARYDAEGTAGIINIITKRTTLQGLTMDINSGVGNRGANLGLQGNYRVGKMGFSLSGFGRANYNVIGEGETIQRGLSAENPFTVQQNTKSLNRGAFGRYSLGWDYDIDKNTFITAGVRYGMRNNLVDQTILSRNTFGSGMTRTSLRDVDVKDLSGTVDVNVDYTKTLKKPQQELNILTLFSRNNRTNDFDANIFSGETTSSSILGQENNRNRSFNQETTFELNYQTPIGKSQLFETGAKTILRQVNSTFTYFSNVGQARPGNALDYDQNIGAAYVSYTLNTKSKYSFKIGSRYEYTAITGTLQGDTRLNIPNYHNLVPSVNISKTLKGGRTLKLAYNRRLQRPGIQFLNPNVNNANPQNISVGNPNLEPELTDQFELATSWFKKSVYINFSAFARTTNNSIESIRFTDDEGVITTTFGNIGQKQNYGVNVFGNVTLFSKWQIGGGVDGYYANISNNSPDPTLGASNSGFVVSGRFFTNVTLKNGWGIQGFGFMRGREVQLQGFQTGFGIYTLGFKKDFKNKQGSVGLGVENFLSNTFKIRTELASPLFVQNNVNLLYNRGIRMNFQYKIGKMSFDAPQRRRKSINNDDVKSGGEGGATGGDAPAAAPAGGGGGRPR